jgi:hypothetical protein
MTIQTQAGKSVEADQGDLVRPIIRGKEPTGQVYAIEPRGPCRWQHAVIYELLGRLTPDSAAFHLVLLFSMIGGFSGAAARLFLSRTQHLNSVVCDSGVRGVGPGRQHV